MFTYKFGFSDDIGARIVAIAEQYLGVPYVYGGSDPSGFDCSGFTQYVYAQVGISISRSSYAQRSDGYEVSEEDMLPGDLICFSGHVGIYIGDGQVIHSPDVGDVVKISSLETLKTYVSPIITIRRLY